MVTSRLSSRKSITLALAEGIQLIVSPTSTTNSPIQLEDDVQPLHTHASISPDTSKTQLRTSKSFVSRFMALGAIMNVKTILSALAYIIIGTMITFYNKWLLSTKHFNFEVTMILCHSFLNFWLAGIWLLSCSSVNLRESPEWPTRIERRMLLYRFFPVGVLLGFDITLTNLAFRLSNVALTEVVKAGIPAIVLIEGVYSQREKASPGKFIVTLILCLGIVLTTFGGAEVKLDGLLAALAAMACGATKLLLMQNVVSGKHCIHPLLSLFYFAPAACVSLVIPFVLFEASSLISSEWIDANHLVTTALLLAVGGVLAFLLNVTELLVIQVSSALSLCVAGVIKLIIVIAISVGVTHHSFTKLNALGIFLAICGVISYNYLRFQERESIVGTATYSYISTAELHRFDDLLPDPLELSQLNNDAVYNRIASNDFGL